MSGKLFDSFFKKISFIYLSKRVTAQAGGVQAKGEAASWLNKEPDSELNPRTLGS